MTNIILFQFESNEIRFVGTAENPEWIAEDICKALDIVNTSQAIESIPEDEKGIWKTYSGENTPLQMLTVNEPGLYRLIFKSRKPAAKRMKKWVFSVVLPSIRKTGSYSIAPVAQVKPLLIEQSEKVAQSIERIQSGLGRSNPRLAQILVDIGVNDFIESNQPKLATSKEFPEDKWYGLVQIANKIGITTNESTRGKLGTYISKLVKSGQLDVDRVREERICNGQQQEIWCYRDTDVIREAIKNWKEQ